MVSLTNTQNTHQFEFLMFILFVLSPDSIELVKSLGGWSLNMNFTITGWSLFSQKHDSCTLFHNESCVQTSPQSKSNLYFNRKLKSKLLRNKCWLHRHTNTFWNKWRNDLNCFEPQQWVKPWWRNSTWEHDSTESDAASSEWTPSWWAQQVVDGSWQQSSTQRDEDEDDTPPPSPQPPAVILQLLPPASFLIPPSSSLLTLLEGFQLLLDTQQHCPSANLPSLHHTTC